MPHWTPYALVGATRGATRFRRPPTRRPDSAGRATHRCRRARLLGIGHPSVCTTCVATSLSGLPTGTGLTPRAPSPIRGARRRARVGCGGACGRGRRGRTSAPRGGTRTCQRRGISASVFVVRRMCLDRKNQRHARKLREALISGFEFREKSRPLRHRARTLHDAPAVECGALHDGHLGVAIGGEFEPIGGPTGHRRRHGFTRVYRLPITRLIAVAGGALRSPGVAAGELAGVGVASTA